MTNGDAGVGTHSDAALLRLQPALVRWFSELTHQGVFATDAEFRIVLWNRWMELHSGSSAAEVAGRSLFDLYPDLIERGLHEYYRAARAGRVTVVSHGLHRYVLAFPPTSESLTSAEMPQTGHIGPLQDASGIIIGTVTILDDVSERLGAEAELRRQIDAQRLARRAFSAARRWNQNC